MLRDLEIIAGLPRSWMLAARLIGLYLDLSLIGVGNCCGRGRLLEVLAARTFWDHVLVRVTGACYD